MNMQSATQDTVLDLLDQDSLSWELSQFQCKHSSWSFAPFRALVP